MYARYAQPMPSVCFVAAGFGSVGKELADHTAFQHSVGKLLDILCKVSGMASVNI